MALIKEVNKVVFMFINVMLNDLKDDKQGIIRPCTLEKCICINGNILGMKNLRNPCFC